MIEFSSDCSPAEKEICHIVGLLQHEDHEAIIYLDAVDDKVIVETRPSGRIRMDLPASLFCKLGNVLKVNLGMIPQKAITDMSGDIKVQDRDMIVYSLSVTIKPGKTERYSIRLIKTAQQVDSAEASTIAVPPSLPSGSPR